MVYDRTTSGHIETNIYPIPTLINEDNTVTWLARTDLGPGGVEEERERGRRTTQYPTDRPKILDPLSSIRESEREREHLYPTYHLQPTQPTNPKRLADFKAQRQNVI